MGKRLVTAALIVVAVVSVLAGCHRDGRLIPRKDLARIYADMLIADQWLNDHRALRRQADTTLFYEPIFQHYGYTTADYTYSVRHYMDDPERFSRILKKSSTILGVRVRKLKAYEEEMRRIKDNSPVFEWEDVDVISWGDQGFIPADDSTKVLIVLDSLKYFLYELPGKVCVQPRRSEDIPGTGADFSESGARKFPGSAEEVLLDNGPHNSEDSRH